MTNHVRSVFLIRHGRTSYNAAHKLQGQVDIPLDAVGEWQVKQTAAALKRLYVDRRQEINHRFIVCSDLKRAHATAQAFADVLGGIEPVDDRRVRERSFGDWDGHAVAELAKRYPEDFRSWMESRGGELKYGAEPKEAVGKRGVEVLQFNAHPFHAGGGQLDAPEGQRLTVILVQQAAALTGVRQHVVIGSQQKEVAGGMPVIPGDLTDGHLIQSHGDGTHAVLGQHQSEQPLKLALFQVFFP